MKNLDQIEVGTEVCYLDSKGEKVAAIVSEVNNKTFTAQHIEFNECSNEWNTFYAHFFLKSGKKSNRYYNYGNVVEVIGKV